MDVVGKAKRVRFYVNEGDKIGHQPAAMALVEWLRREDTQGATVFRSIGGFGAAGHIHTTHLVDVAQNMPLVVEWIDALDVVERLLPRLTRIVPRGLVTMEDVEVVLHQTHPVRDLPMALTAADVMSREVTAVSKDAPLANVVALMLGKLYRAVPVVDGGIPVGMICNSDLVQKGGLTVRLDLLSKLDKPAVHETLARLAAANKFAADVMTPGPTVVDEGTPLPRVAEVMAHRRLKRLPVVDDHGALVGIVSRLDLLRTVAGGTDRAPATPREMGLADDTPISRIMRTDIPLVHPDTPLPEVFQAVISTRLNRTLVVDADQRVVGLVTDAELLDRLTPSLRPGALRSLMHRLPFHGKVDTSAEQHARARRASDLMSRDVATTAEDTLVSDAIALMLKGSHKVLAVVNASGRLTGMVDRADLLHALVEPA